MISRLTDAFLLILFFDWYIFLSKHFSVANLSSAFTFSSSGQWFENVQILLNWIFLLLSLDFLFYWNHRFSHEINLLWASHVTHHSSEEYNLTVALRQSFLRNAIAMSFYMVFAFLSVPWLILLLADAINRLYQFWVHTRWIPKLPKWFEYIFVSPSHHRVHHARNEIYLDKNYAGMFILWDRLFGTIQEENEEPKYGIVKPLLEYDPIRANVHVFSEIVSALKFSDSIAKTLKILFGKPRDLPISAENPSARILFQKNRESSPLSLVLAGSTFLLLVGLSLLLIKKSSLIETKFALVMYFGLLGAFGLLGKWNDTHRKTLV
ncbi:fatty acid hydroxylase family protein [Leptospira ryugenii]|uniref:Fatty acid hydroxylase family protein n=2 Tax=Leptospira ryugenii TaxID=1917863 RepID=A0A2P2E0V7_9LEPT|nr:fatty acid hydroxylase family protein [Leptospira ryugenii]